MERRRVRGPNHVMAGHTQVRMFIIRIDMRTCVHVDTRSGAYFWPEHGASLSRSAAGATRAARRG